MTITSSLTCCMVGNEDSSPADSFRMHVHLLNPGQEKSTESPSSKHTPQVRMEGWRMGSLDIIMLGMVREDWAM